MLLSYTSSHLWVSDLFSETFMQIKLWQILAKRVLQVFIVTVLTKKEKKRMSTDAKN